jgi:alkylation response protein AidB-like acyl-CoA dehydrogenase
MELKQETTSREDREQLRELAAEFNERVVLPAAAELDRQPTPQEAFSWEIIEEASRIGLRTLTLAPEHGGPGVDSLGAAIVIEELAKGDMGVAVMIAQTLKLIQTVQAACTEEQLERFVPRIREDDRFLLAIGLTEPDTGSNYIIPFEDPKAGYRTNAVRRGGGWVINGRKHFVSNGNRAGLYLLFAQTAKDTSLTQGSTCFLVEPGAEGFEIGTVHDKMGERLANNAELVFEDCFVPDANVVGEPDRGFEVQSQFFPASNAYAAATVLGTATAAYERALAWTRQRVQGGKPLIEHDTVGAQLAEMRMLLDVARTYTHHAAEAADHRDGGWDPTLAAFPKLFASQVAWTVTTKAMELHGGYGFMRNLGMEKLLRDAAAFLHSDGANLTLLLKAAKAIRAEVP